MGRFAPHRAIGGLFLLSALAALTISCGGGASSPPSGGVPGSGGALVFIGDAPPAGSTILKFEITLSGAVLCPQVSGNTCQGTPQSPLLSAPVEIELTQLELETAFLSLRSVPAGSYAGVQLTFANPELKLLQSDGTVQELTPPLNPAMVVVSFPSALVVTADSNVGFLVDFNVANSIQSVGTTVTGIAPQVSLVQLPALANQNLEELDDVTGVVSNLNKTCPTGSFTLTESLTGLPIGNIRFDATTGFEAEDGVTFDCNALANGQIVELDVELRVGATSQTVEFFAEEIELINPPNEDEVEGVVFQVNSTGQFVLLVLEEEGLPNVAIGSFVTVNFDPGTVDFRTDEDDLPVVPADFDSGDEILVGQKLEVDVVDGTLVVPPAGCATLGNCTATGRRLKLKKSTLTGRVASISGSTFTLDQLPGIFGDSMARPLSADCQACSISSILVTTSSATEWESPLTSIGNLTVGNIVSVRGVLLKGAFAGPSPGSGQPELVAGKVRRRSP